MNESEEEKLLKSYPPLFEENTKLAGKPMTIADRHGRILLWYLPSVLTVERQDEIWRATGHLETIMKTNFAKSESWRTNRDNFHDPTECEIHPGALDLSPGWFHQGHTV